MMNRHPPVSCICLTYARPALLDEAICSFLQQDYAGPKELIVLNDYDGQYLELEHPEVRIVNLSKRLRTVGEKMNMAVALAAYDLLFVWDDDDIYLPHRLSFSVEHLRLEKSFFKPDKGWVWDSGSLRGPATYLFHAGSCWTRSSNIRWPPARARPATWKRWTSTLPSVRCSTINKPFASREVRFAGRMSSACPIPGDGFACSVKMVR